MLQRIIRSKSRKIPGHSCDLPIIPDPGTYLLYEGIFVETRRRLWKWRTIDPSSPDSKRHLKSAAMIYEEELQHMYKYSNMIHPFSKFRFFWQKIMIIVFLSLVICIPVTISDTQHSPDSLMVIHTIMSLICFIDIILWFRTGYYDVSKDKIVMKPSNVAKRYVMSYFIFDLLSSQPIELYLYSVTEEYSKNHVYTAILLLKIVRIPTLVDYLNKYCERRNFFVNGIKLFSFVIWIVVILTWTTSTIFMLGHNVVGDPTLFIDIPGFPMLLTTFRVARGLTVVGVTEKINKNDMLLILEILVILMGTILNIFILAKIAQFYQKRSSSKKKYEGLLEEIHEYIKYKELPLKLKSKILRYMEFKYAQHIFREEDILNNLSSVLKNDIMIERCHSMIGKVDLFKDLPPHVLLRIVIKLRSEIFLPNDIIVLAGYPGHAMYFIYMGTVAVYTANGHEICHLEDGNHFGEIALLYNEPRVATVIAVKECEVFRLSRRDFQEALEPYPQLSKKIRQLAVNRLENTIQIMAERTESNFMIPSTIMSELKSRDFGLD